MKKLILIIICGIFLVNFTGCTYKNRVDFVSKDNKTSQTDAMMQSVIDTLEAQDVEALKSLFSPYALEYAEDLDGKIEELMEFYPGSEGGFKGSYISSKRTQYGVITLKLTGIYMVTNDNQEYEMCLVTCPRDDEEPDKIGLYLIQVMTKEAEPEGFKWKNKNSTPGIYVLE